jgi:hypothetical protein
MIQRICAPDFFISFDRHRFSQKRISRIFFAASALSSSLVAGVWMLDMRHVPAPDITTVAEAPGAASTPVAASNAFGALLVDMRARSRSMLASLAQNPTTEPERQPTPAIPSTAGALAENLQPAPPQAAPQLDDGAPLPPRRPAEFESPIGRGSPSRAPARELAQQNRKSAALEATPSDSSTLFDRFFGALQASEPKPSTPALAYAAPETSILDNARKLLSSPLQGYGEQTAVYDISAHTVYLPDGTKLEAHSGLGDKFDDPRYVHVRMRGSTPPHTYELSLRERPFHGVKALRLTPVGEGHIFGRAGLLAHTYMLGPRGDSNGCVSVKNYDVFLRAFQNGQIKRLVVVARRG